MTPLQALLVDIVIILTMLFIQGAYLKEKVPNWYKFLGGFLVVLIPFLIIKCIFYYITF